MKDKGGRPRGSRDIAGKIRYGFLDALKKIETESGRSIGVLMKQEIEEHGLVHVARAISAYSPKELNVATTEISPEKWLELMADATEQEITNPENSV